MAIHKDMLKVRKGVALPLGASVSDEGVNFSFNSNGISQCRLNIYENGIMKPCLSVDLTDKHRVGDILCVFVEGFDIDKHEYSYEIMGQHEPDPMSLRIHGRYEWGKPLGKKEEMFIRSAVTDDCFDWKGDKNPCIPYEDAIFYKAHLRGFTKHPSSKVRHKGTFKGFEEKAEYLKELGITSVILMPVYEFDEIIYDRYVMGPEEPEFMEYGEFLKEQEKEEDPVVAHFERKKQEKGIIPYKLNFWGYGTQRCYYFAPKESYASVPGNAQNEFKSLIRTLHSYGIECIMEFVFPDKIGKQFVCDCFRHWVMEYHVDGFKFNASAIRGEYVAADPILGRTKLICEGWNEGEIFAGNKPLYRNLAVMNNDFMINARKYLKGDEEQLGDFAYKYRRNSCNTGIINYITDSDGFTLADLYSYDVKHNDANGEFNRDGTDYNYSWNCGVEGKTRKSKVLSFRKKQMKNAMTLLLLSQSSPMLLAGDEMYNSQDGNNNAYCQDNPIAWVNWNNTSLAKEMTEYVKMLIGLRKSHKILHMKDELRLMDYASLGCPDLSYHGTRAWYPEFSMYSRTLGILLYGKYAGVKADNSFYFAINMHWEQHEFDLPKLPDGKKWTCIIDTSGDSNKSEVKIIDEKSKNTTYMVASRSVAIFMA